MFLIHCYLKYSNKKVFLYLATCLLIIFAISRVVGPGLGGADALSYQLIFGNSLIETTGNSVEFLFLYFTRSIRLFTDEPIVYRFFCYSLISTSYFIFIKYFCPNKASSIPFLALVVPYLLSFNTMRTSMAAAIFLFALVLLRNGKLFLACGLCISSIFFHRMSILYVPVLIFYFLVKGGWIFKTKWRLLLVVFLLTLISIFVANFLQSYILVSFNLEGADAYYLRANSELSIFSSAALVLPLILLFSFIMISSLNYDNNKGGILLQSLVIYDIIVFPMSFILGMWRANEFFYVPRLIMWAILIAQFRLRFDSKFRIVIDIAFFIGFFFWVIDRIDGIWESAALMPYMLNWF